MAKEDLDALLERMNAIAAAVNSFTSETVQHEAFSALIAAFEDRRHGAKSSNAAPAPEPSSAVPEEVPEVAANGGNSAGGRRKPAKRKRATVTSGEGQAAAYVPAMDKSVDVKGAAEYYAKFMPKSHSEKVLIFANFLKEKGNDPCTADQIFTCYVAAKTPRPKAFRQAIIDAHGQKHGFIDYKSVSDISVTHIGEDHLNFTMTKVSE